MGLNVCGVGQWEDGMVEKGREVEGSVGRGRHVIPLFYMESCQTGRQRGGMGEGQRNDFHTLIFILIPICAAWIVIRARTLQC